MGKRDPTRRSKLQLDPEYLRWMRKYPQFPGVVECSRLIQAGKAKGTWAEIIVQELAEHASECLPEMIEAFHTAEGVALYVIMALDIARPPEAVEFLIEVLRRGDPQYSQYAREALAGIGTVEARSALWEISQMEQGKQTFR
jgi:hypothetical protein